MLHTTLVERISDQSFQVNCAVLQHEDFTALESAVLEVYFGSNDHVFEDYLLQVVWLCREPLYVGVRNDNQLENVEHRYEMGPVQE